MDAEFILLCIDTKNYETTRISWDIAIFPKGTPNGLFWPKCKEGPNNNGITNTAECIVELYKHAGIFKNTREVRVFLKIPKCLYNSTMLEEQVFYFFYKIKATTKGQEFVRQQKWARILIDQH